MATFHSSSSYQRDTMHALYLKEPTMYSESDPSVSSNGNMPYLSYSSSSPYSNMMAGNSYSQQNCIDLPVSSTIISQESYVAEPDSVASHIGEPSYNALRDGRNEMLFIQTIGGSMSGAVNLFRHSITDDSQMGLRTPVDILNGQDLSSHQTNVSTVQGQGLSLSLSTQIPVPSFQYHPAGSDVSILNSHQSTSGNGGPCCHDNSRSKLMHACSSPSSLSNLMSTIPNSKYLKAAQQVLDEVANIWKVLKLKADKSQSINNSGTTGCKENNGLSKSDGMALNLQESRANSSSELSPSERQDLQSKITKLLAMLDEVDRRYKQYHHQMQVVVSSFDVIAGCGAAKFYTALALQTISRQFRCLRDAISNQIRSTRNNLGTQDSSTSKGGAITPLRHIDQHLRQKIAIQQLGMFQQHVWRPQRGLPETSVSVLRAWLFEHFLHPYPSESEKLLLARQAGLTRSQISNWFINARVRLWKPMIEKIYKEEVNDTGMDSNPSSENAAKSRDEIRSSKEMQDMQSYAAERCHIRHLMESSNPNNHISNAGTSPRAADFLNDASPRDAYMNLKSRDQRTDVDDYGLLRKAITNSDGSARFMTCPIAESGSYGYGEISLTLGLQHCDSGLAVRGDSGLAVRGEGIFSVAEPPLGADVADYNCMNLADQLHRFGSSHLLHDFVA